MNVEIWHFPLCGLSVHMVYKDAQCAPFVGGMHTHYRRGDHWSPATNKTVSFIFHSQFRLAKSRLRRLLAGRPLRWVSPFSIWHTRKIKRRELSLSPWIQQRDSVFQLDTSLKVLSPLLKTRSAQKCKHILLIILNTRLIKWIYSKNISADTACELVHIE